MINELNTLTKVRHLREERAQTTARKSKQRLQDCTATRDEARTALRDYQSWREQREDLLFNNIRNQQIKPKALEELKQRIQSLRLREQQLEKELDEKQEALNSADKVHREDRKNLIIAGKAREKIEICAEECRKALGKIQEQKQELELEDLSGRKELTHANA